MKRSSPRKTKACKLGWVDGLFGEFRILLAAGPRGPLYQQGYFDGQRARHQIEAALLMRCLRRRRDSGGLGTPLGTHYLHFGVTEVLCCLDRPHLRIVRYRAG